MFGNNTSKFYLVKLYESQEKEKSNKGITSTCPKKQKNEQKDPHQRLTRVELSCQKEKSKQVKLRKIVAKLTEPHSPIQ